MAGCQMCSGENSVPTWPFHCFDKSILTIDRSPELTAVTPRPSVKNTPDGSILESRAPTTPVALRPVSASHAPAVVSAPCAQFRKSLLPLPNHRPELGFWGCRKSFRNWVLGDGQAGIHVADMGRNLTATWTTGWITHLIPTIYTSGAAFTVNETANEASIGSVQNANQPFHVGIDAGRVWGTEHVGTEFAPTHVQLPVILYLGRPAQV